MKNFIKVGEVALANGGAVSFEWPRYNLGWMISELIEFITQHGLHEALVDGCACGMKNSNGEPLLKPWRFITSSASLASNLCYLRCPHVGIPGFKHGELSGGSETAKTAAYPDKLCRAYLTGLFGSYTNTPAMSCTMPTGNAQEHRKKFVMPDDEEWCGYGFSPYDYPVAIDVTDPEFEEPTPIPSMDREAAFLAWKDTLEKANDEPNALEFAWRRRHRDPASVVDAIHGAIHKLLTRAETYADPKAIDSIRAEAAGLQKYHTWLETPMLRKDLFARAMKERKTFHFGELLTICSIKHAESPDLAKHKGRICYMGDRAKDQHGQAAVYQELSSSPTGIFDVNAAIAWGCCPGNTTTAADAIKAYVQSWLKSANETYVAIPFELWPKCEKCSKRGSNASCSNCPWQKLGFERKGERRPLCRLQKALYGHPESGAHWEQHLKEAVMSIGGEQIPGHPSMFFFAKELQLLTVYVDDLLMSGPIDSQDGIWERLRALVSTEDPEPLDRFLGRAHVFDLLEGSGKIA